MRLAEAGLTVKDLDFGAVDAEADLRLAEYFVNTPQVEEAIRFRSAHFIGRKGSGKSAIFTQLPRLADIQYGKKISVSLMTPDQYAWGALKEYQEKGLLPEQAHTNAWKFTIAVEAASAALELDQNVLDDSSRRSVKKIKDFIISNYGDNAPTPAKTARRLIKGLNSFNLEAFGFGLGFEKDKQDFIITPQITDLLLESVKEVCNGIGVIVAADKLDDSWDGSDMSKSLMIGLMKASKEINDEYSNSAGSGIHVITFIRSDIYQLIEFDDKDKHRAIEEEILWDADLLREMISARLPESVGIDDIFEEGEMRGSISPFNYIVKRTFLRPREVIQFLQECRKRTPKGESEITKDTIRSAEEKYSSWKVEDLKQEYRRLIPLFAEMLESLRQTQHRYDSIEDFHKMILDQMSDITSQTGTRLITEHLFNTSVIGVRLGNAGTARFRCEDPDLKLPASGSVYIHQSLYKGLNIKETRSQ